jgi:hypothetical protein
MVQPEDLCTGPRRLSMSRACGLAAYSAVLLMAFGCTQPRNPAVAQTMCVIPMMPAIAPASPAVLAYDARDGIGAWSFVGGDGVEISGALPAPGFEAVRQSLEKVGLGKADGTVTWALGEAGHCNRFWRVALRRGERDGPELRWGRDGTIRLDSYRTGVRDGPYAAWEPAQREEGSLRLVLVGQCRNGLAEGPEHLWKLGPSVSERVHVHKKGLLVAVKTNRVSKVIWCPWEEYVQRLHPDA